MPKGKGIESSLVCISVWGINHGNRRFYFCVVCLFVCSFLLVNIGILYMVLRRIKENFKKVHISKSQELHD